MIHFDHTREDGNAAGRLDGIYNVGADAFLEIFGLPGFTAGGHGLVALRGTVERVVVEGDERGACLLYTSSVSAAPPPHAVRENVISPARAKAANLFAFLIILSPLFTDFRSSGKKLELSFYSFTL